MSNATADMISVRGLRVIFDGRPVLDGIDLGVPEGGTFVLLGKNGSGKSVTLKAIAGLVQADEGSISLNGVDIGGGYRKRDSALSAGNGTRLAYVFQKGGLFDSMNLFDNVAFGLRRMGKDEEEVARRVGESLARVGLRGSEEKLPSELSGGMQKRAGLARAVCMEPNIILYDDPTAGLDPILSDSITDLILEIRDALKTTSVIVTQDLEVAAKVADTIALLYEGRIVCRSATNEFFSRSDPYARQFIEGDIEGPIDIY